MDAFLFTFQRKQKKKKLFLEISNIQIDFIFCAIGSFVLVKIVDCRVGQLFREAFLGLKLPRTFSISSPIGHFETLYVIFDPFWLLKVLEMDFYKGA